MDGSTLMSDHTIRHWQSGRSLWACPFMGPRNERICRLYWNLCDEFDVDGRMFNLFIDRHQGHPFFQDEEFN